MCLEQIDDTRHGTNGVAAEFRPGTMGSLAFGFKLQPKVALVGGDDLQHRGFPGDRQIGLKFALAKGTRTGLAAFLIDKAGKDDLGVLRSLLLPCEFAERVEIDGDTALCVAGSAAVESVILNDGLELASVGRNDIKMWSQQDTALNLADRLKGDE